MTHTNLSLDSLVSHLAALPGRIAESPVAAPHLPATPWWPPGSPDADLGEALAGELGPRWTGYDALTRSQRRVAAFLVAQGSATWEAALAGLARDLADGSDAPPDDDGRARAACEAEAGRHAYVSTVFQALFAARPGLPLPSWPFAALDGEDAMLRVLALDRGRRMRLPAALPAHFHHALELAFGKPIENPRFEGLATILSRWAATSP